MKNSIPPRKLYIIAGPSRIGKSTIKDKITEREKSFMMPEPNSLCRPIVRNILSEEIPKDIKEVALNGIATFGSQLEEAKQFNLSFPVSSSIAPPIQESLIVLPTDYIRSIIRFIFTGNGEGINAIGFEGTRTFTSSKNEKLSSQPFKIRPQPEDPNAWDALIGLIKDYDRANQNDVLIEGVAITPDRVHELELKLENLAIKTAFIGYSDDSVAEDMLKYAKEHKDHLYEDMEASGEGDEFVRKMVRGQIPKNAETKKRADELGYRYFDRIDNPFEEHTDMVLSHLLS